MNLNKINNTTSTVISTLPHLVSWTVRSAPKPLVVIVALAALTALGLSLVAVYKMYRSHATSVLNQNNATGVAQTVVKATFNHWYRANHNTAPRVDINNIEYENIPDEHESDPIFSQFICPLTKFPIRYPVTIADPRFDDQGNPSPDFHFERHAIVTWLSNYDTNPQTNLPITIHDLRENLEMRRIIEEQMERLSIPR